MDIIKIRITTDTDIITALGNIKSETPLKVEIPNIDVNLFEEAIMIQLQWNENGKISELDVELKGFNQSIFEFKPISNVKQGLERDYYRIDFKGIYKVKSLKSETIQSISRMVSKKASTIKTSVASKIKQIIPHETTSNQHILRFLLEIDNKLDNILEIISDSKEDDNYLVVDAIDISGGGLCFFTTEKFEKGELLYLDVELDDTTNKVEFVSVGKILNIIKTNKGFIYSLEFQNLDPDFSENIIKYVFEKERIMIQELKNK